MIKVSAVFCLVLAVILFICSCSTHVSARPNPILMSDSCFLGWYVEGEAAYMVCRLLIKSESDCTVSITAFSNEDVGSLIIDEKLIGYNEYLTSTSFDLKNGRNECTVIFKGRAVKKSSVSKADTALPDIIDISPCIGAA